MPASHPLLALLDSLRRVTGVRAVYRFLDEQVGSRGERSEFCHLFHRGNPEAAALCEDFHRELLAAARQDGRTIRRTCRNDCSALVAPILCNGQLRGFVESEPLALEGETGPPEPARNRPRLRRDTGRCDRKLDRAFSDLLLSAPSWPDGLVHLFDYLVEHAAAILATMPASARDHPSHSATLVERAQAYLREHHTEPVSSLTVAEALRVSEGHVCRAFRKATGTTISAWLTGLRLEAACTLLLAHPREKIDEIGSKAGFQSNSRFYAAFHRKYGMAPGEWRRRQMEG